MWPFEEQIDYTPNVCTVNNSPDNVPDLRGRTDFSSCDKSSGPGLRVRIPERKVLLQVLEALNTITGAIDKVSGHRCR